MSNDKQNRIFLSPKATRFSFARKTVVSETVP